MTSTGSPTADPASGRRLYRRTLSTNQTQLIASGSIGGGFETGVLGVSGDGPTVVFSGTNVLGPVDGLSLYVHRGGTTTRVMGCRRATRARTIASARGS